MNVVVNKEALEMAIQSQNLTKMLMMLQYPKNCSTCIYFKSHRPTYAGTCTKLAINPDDPINNGCTDYVSK